MALTVVIALWCIWSPGRLVWAEAAEINNYQPSDYVDHPSPLQYHPDLVEEPQGLDLDENLDDVRYEPDFPQFSRSIIGRAPDGVDSLTNNVKTPMDLKPGSTHNFIFAQSEVEGKHANPGVGLPSPLDGRSSNFRSNGMLDTPEECYEDNPEPISSHGEGSSRQTETPADSQQADLNSSNELKRDERAFGDDGDAIQKRQTGHQVYISVNTCRQPSANGTVSSPPPQLTLYVATSDNQKPGPDSDQNLVTSPISFDGGFVSFNLTASSDINIGVYAPPLPPNYSGNYHFEVAASIDRSYYNYNGTSSFTYLVDTDTHSAILVTHNLTAENSSQEVNDKWMGIDSPFTLYAFNESNSAMQGLQKSFCGLQQQFEAANLQIASGMTKWGEGSRPKQLFHVEGLNASSQYSAFLVMQGNGTTDSLDVEGNAVVGGGGQVWQQIDFRTKSGMRLLNMNNEI